MGGKERLTMTFVSIETMMLRSRNVDAARVVVVMRHWWGMPSFATLRVGVFKLKCQRPRFALGLSPGWQHVRKLRSNNVLTAFF